MWARRPRRRLPRISALLGALRGADADALVEVPDVGPVVAASVRRFFDDSGKQDR